MSETGSSRSHGRESHAEWQLRYDRTWSKLNDTEHVLELERLIAGSHPAAPPSAYVIAGDVQPKPALHVGLLAGSFNPLTLAHLAIAQSARKTAHLDALVWTVAVVTVEKERVERAALSDRLAQLEALVVADARGAVALVNRGLYVEQVRALRTQISADATVAVVVGFDKVVQIFDPRYYADRDAALADLFSEARVLVAPRGHEGERELEELLSRPENARFANSVRMIPLPDQHRRDSSTEARDLASEGRFNELRSLLPPEGCALADTGTYAMAGVHEQDDVYRRRQLWLRALAGIPTATRPTLPPLNVLADLAADQGATGEAIRRLLTQPRASDSQRALGELLHTL